MRIFLFLATNMAVLVLVSIIFNLLGLEGILAQNGVDLNLGPLLIFCALFGFGGSLISLFLSKWMAKRGTGIYMIEQARNSDEQWLLDKVKELSEEAGIGMPEVGIFPSEAANAFATGWNRNAALQRLQMEQNQPQDLPGELTAFGISEQLKQGISGLFRSHPPLDDRIRALQEA